MPSPDLYVIPQDDPVDMADSIEKGMLEAVVQTAVDISRSFGTPPFAIDILSILGPLIRQAAEEMAEVVATGGSPIKYAERFAERLEQATKES